MHKLSILSTLFNFWCVWLFQRFICPIKWPRYICYSKDQLPFLLVIGTNSNLFKILTTIVGFFEEEWFERCILKVVLKLWMHNKVVDFLKSGYLDVHSLLIIKSKLLEVRVRTRLKMNLNCLARDKVLNDKEWQKMTKFRLWDRSTVYLCNQKSEPSLLHSNYLFSTELIKKIWMGRRNKWWLVHPRNYSLISQKRFFGFSSHDMCWTEMR